MTIGTLGLKGRGVPLRGRQNHKRLAHAQAWAQIETTKVRRTNCFAAPATSAIFRWLLRRGRHGGTACLRHDQSLDGYVDHMAFAPGPVLFRHFIEEAEKQTGSIYGRRMYEIMRYWDDDHPDWEPEGQAFAAAWRKQPKWVVSSTLTSVGPKATLVRGELEGAIKQLKAEHDGEIEVAGPRLAKSLTALGLIDEYRIYLHPVVIGGGDPYFAEARPPLRLVGHDLIDGDVVRLRYVPA
jgi:dihydrofolate reductase